MLAIITIIAIVIPSVGCGFYFGYRLASKEANMARQGMMSIFDMQNKQIACMKEQILVLKSQLPEETTKTDDIPVYCS